MQPSGGDLEESLVVPGIVFRVIVNLCFRESISLLDIRCLIMTIDGLEQARLGNPTGESKIKKERNVVLKNRDAVVVVNSTAPNHACAWACMPCLKIGAVVWVQG